jgi:NADPH2:quinone reductase
MSSMSIRALIVDPQARDAIRTALIAVHHISLNPGDLNDARSGRIPSNEIV